MAAPYNTLRSKLNRAIAAYLISEGCGSKDDVSPANSTTNNAYPLTIVQAVMSKPDPDYTGNRRITVHIHIKGSATSQRDEPNPDQPRLDFDNRIATTFDALMQTEDGQSLHATAEAITAAGRAVAVAVDDSDESKQFAANNADMADFTVMGWYEMGEGQGKDDADAEGSAWHEVLIFEALCCGSNVD